MKFFVIGILYLLSLVVYAAPIKSLPKVTTTKMEMTKVKQSLVYPGLIKSRVESNVKAEENFIVVQHFVELGQLVKEGEKLLELKIQDSGAHYQNRILRSPVSGVVASLSVQRGQFVQKGEDLMLINDPQRLFVKSEVPLAHFRDLKVGLKTLMTLSSFKNEIIEAQLKSIGALVDSGLATVPVEFEIISPAKNILPGVIAQMEIILEEKEKMMIEEKALYYAGDKVFLPKIENGKIVKIPVKLGWRENGRIEITEGVILGDEIITGSGEFLKDGQEVEKI